MATNQDEVSRLSQLAHRVATRWGPQNPTPAHTLVWVPDPGVYRVDDGGELFVVIDDKPIIRMMNRQGHVFSTVRSQCQDLDRDRKVLMCPRADMILCSGDTDTDRFVSDEIRPLLEGA